MTPETEELLCARVNCRDGHGQDQRPVSRGIYLLQESARLHKLSRMESCI